VNSSLVQKNIASIQQAFKEGKNLAELFNGVNLNEKLNSEKDFFTSAKFEGAAYQIALNCFEENNSSFQNCAVFFEQNSSHQIQIAIGFGWASAETTSLNFHKHFDFLPCIFQQKIADGFGYYEGVFRKRKCLIQQEKPNLMNELLPFYFYGLGRSLWYSTLGEIAKTKSAIENFPKETQSFLWQGVGTAFAYVGGFDKNYFCNIQIAADSYYPFLREGIIHCYYSRKIANLLTQDLELAMQWL
jgi:hypothetical protein